MKQLAAFGIVIVLGVIALVFISARTARRDPRTAGITAAPLDQYDPVRAGEEVPRGFRQLLTRDQIAPIYQPTFTDPDSVDWPADSLVIGVEGERETKAYPITPLNQREMVVDYLDGSPILVSW